MKAGIKTKFDKGASECFQTADVFLMKFNPLSYEFQIPSTPDNVRRYRRHTSVGRREANQYDKLNNSLVYQPNYVFGKKSGAADPVILFSKRHFSSTFTRFQIYSKMKV